MGAASAAGTVVIGSASCNVEVALVPSGHGKEAVELSIVRRGAHARHVLGDAEVGAPSATLPASFVPDPGRLLLAAQWVLDVDFRAQQQVLAGERVVKSVPGSSPPALARPANEESEEAYWDLRRPAGVLIRPLLLPVEVELSDLFPYQRAGVDWLCERDAAILADDMGLGKTVQVISAMRMLLRRGEVRSALVISPRSMLATWEDELARWAPELTCLRLTPSAGAKERAWKAVLGRVHVTVTNYEHLREPPTVLLEHELPLLVADEAHRVRNVEARVTSGLRRLRTSRFWAVTGTPIERDSRDLITLLSIMEPYRFSVGEADETSGVLRARARPYVLRRVKDDVLEQLPEVIERTERLELLPAQRRAYERVLERARRDGHSSDETLRVINELRAVCDYDPATGASAKLERSVEILEAVRASGEKAVVFSTLVRPLELLKGLLGRLATPVGARLYVGELDLDKRERIIAEFKADPEITALLASARIAGEGLTLTEANHVLFVNDWWNPSSNRQARDRVVRIGQRRGVDVYHFMCRGTIEESLVRILERKSELFADVIERLNAPQTASDPQVRELIDELIDEPPTEH
jgi:SNF2 family DNA or RNA helicase